MKDTFSVNTMWPLALIYSFSVAAQPSSRGESNQDCDRAYAAALENAAKICKNSKRTVGIHGGLDCITGERTGSPHYMAEILFECQGSTRHIASGSHRSRETAINLAIQTANKKCANEKEFIRIFALAGCRQVKNLWDCDLIFDCTISK